VAAAAEALVLPSGELRAQPPHVAFYEQLIQARCSKAFHLTFFRSVGASKLQDAFRKPLERMTSQACAEQVKRLLAAVPNVNEGDVIIFSFAADGATFELSLGGEAPILSMSCEEVWTTVQRIYFDEDTEFQTIRTDVVAPLPSLLLAARDEVEKQTMSLKAANHAVTVATTVSDEELTAARNQETQLAAEELATQATSLQEMNSAEELRSARDREAEIPETLSRSLSALSFCSASSGEAGSPAHKRQQQQMHCRNARLTFVSKLTKLLACGILNTA